MDECFSPEPMEWTGYDLTDMMGDWDILADPPSSYDIFADQSAPHDDQTAPPSDPDHEHFDFSTLPSNFFDEFEFMPLDGIDEMINWEDIPVVSTIEIPRQTDIEPCELLLGFCPPDCCIHHVDERPRNVRNDVHFEESEPLTKKSAFNPL